MILQAISNHLKKHSIPHTHPLLNWIQIPHQPRPINIFHMRHKNTIRITNNDHTHHTTEIDLADPQLLPRILQALQQTCQQ